MSPEECEDADKAEGHSGNLLVRPSRESRWAGGGSEQRERQWAAQGGEEWKVTGEGHRHG